MKVMIMAGGTGGHVFPALAVAAELRQRGHEVVWMGAPDSFESRVVPQHAINMEFIHVSGLRGKGLMKLLWAPLLLLRAVAQAVAVLRRQKPDVTLGMGGFASGPGGLASWLLRRPLVLHEQNAVAGFTNRVLAHFARKTLQAFPGAFAEPVGVTVGNPVRAALTQLPPPAQRLAGRSGPLQVLVIGGSQGAKALNEKVPAALKFIPEASRPVVRHQAGRTLDIAQASYARHGVSAQIEAFIDDMASAFSWADLVICRAGASTVAELAATGSAALMVPFPAAVDDHQTRNAEFLSKNDAGLLIAEKDLSAERLAAVLQDLAVHRGKLLAIAERARALAQPQAVSAIVAQLEAQGVRA